MAYEQRAFWRNRTRAFFSFGMPLMLLLLFGALNSGGRIQELGNIPYVTFFLPGILAYGIIITQFVNMAGGIAIQRDNGLLKRMRGTPLPGWAYVGRPPRLDGPRLGRHDRRHARRSAASCFDVHLRAEAVPAVVVTVLLGAATFAALGMAAVMLIPNAEAAPVVANVLILPLSFISGIWYPLTGAPEWLVDLAKFFPVERLANALHVAFDPLNHGSAWSGNDLLRARPSGCSSARAWRCASGAGRWRAERGSPRIGLRVPAARVAGIFAVFISLPAVIGLLGDEPSAGAARRRRRRARRLLRLLLPGRARADAIPSRRRSSRAPTSSTWPSPAR